MSLFCVRQDDSNMKGGEVMNCKDVAELLPLYMDAELAPDTTSAVEAHLATCSDCQGLLAEYCRTQSILQSLPLVAPPPTWRAELLEKVSGKRRRALSAWRFFVPRLGSLAAALLVILLVGNLYIFPSYVAQGRHDGLLRGMGALAGAPEMEDNKQQEPEVTNEATLYSSSAEPEDDKPQKPYAGLKAADTEARPPEEETGIMVFQATADELAGKRAGPEEAAVAAASPSNDLQKRWWLWSFAMGIVIWVAGAGYCYYRYQHHLRELTDL